MSAFLPEKSLQEEEPVDAELAFDEDDDENEEAPYIPLGPLRMETRRAKLHHRSISSTHADLSSQILTSDDLTTDHLDDGEQELEENDDHRQDENEGLDSRDQDLNENENENEHENAENSDPVDDGTAGHDEMIDNDAVIGDHEGEGEQPDPIDGDEAFNDPLEDTSEKKPEEGTSDLVPSKKANWTATQNAQFFEHLSLYGRDFEKIKSAMPDRNRDQVRQYYYRILRSVKTMLKGEMEFETNNHEQEMKAVLSYWNLKKKLEQCTPLVKNGATSSKEGKLPKMFPKLLGELLKKGSVTFRRGKKNFKTKIPNLPREGKEPDVTMTSSLTLMPACPTTSSLSVGASLCCASHTSLLSSLPAPSDDHGILFWKAMFSRGELPQFVSRDDELLLPILDRLLGSKPSRAILNKIATINKKHQPSSRRQLSDEDEVGSPVVPSHHSTLKPPSDLAPDAANGLPHSARPHEPAKENEPLDPSEGDVIQMAAESYNRNKDLDGHVSVKGGFTSGSRFGESAPMHDQDAADDHLDSLNEKPPQKTKQSRPAKKPAKGEPSQNSLLVYVHPRSKEVESMLKAKSLASTLKLHISKKKDVPYLLNFLRKQWCKTESLPGIQSLRLFPPVAVFGDLAECEVGWGWDSTQVTIEEIFLRLSSPSKFFLEFSIPCDGGISMALPRSLKLQANVTSVLTSSTGRSSLPSPHHLQPESNYNRSADESDDFLPNIGTPAPPTLAVIPSVELGQSQQSELQIGGSVNPSLLPPPSKITPPSYLPVTHSNIAKTFVTVTAPKTGNPSKNASSRTYASRYPPLFPAVKTRGLHKGLPRPHPTPILSHNDNALYHASNSIGAPFSSVYDQYYDSSQIIRPAPSASSNSNHKSTLQYYPPLPSVSGTLMYSQPVSLDLSPPVPTSSSSSYFSFSSANGYDASSNRGIDVGNGVSPDVPSSTNGNLSPHIPYVHNGSTHSNGDASSYSPLNPSAPKFFSNGMSPNTCQPSFDFLAEGSGSSRPHPSPGHGPTRSPPSNHLVDFPPVWEPHSSVPDGFPNMPAGDSFNGTDDGANFNIAENSSNLAFFDFPNEDFGTNEDSITRSWREMGLIENHSSSFVLQSPSKRFKLNSVGCESDALRGVTSDETHLPFSSDALTF